MRLRLALAAAVCLAATVWLQATTLPPAAAAAKQTCGSGLRRTRLTGADRLTNDLSVAFSGVCVSCARCDGRPQLNDWTQDHCSGMKAFLARTYDAGGTVAERGVGIGE